MDNNIPQWVIDYNNAGHQSSAGRAINILMSELTRLRSELQQKDKIIKELIPLAQENAEGICSISESYKRRAQAIVERAKESLKES